MIDFRRMLFLLRHKDKVQMRALKAWAKATRCTSSLSKEPRGGGGIGNQVQDGGDLHMEADEAYSELSRELEGMKADLRRVLPLLDSQADKRMMELRYLDGKSVRSVAIATYYSEDRVKVRLRNAERKVNELLAAMEE